jgi:hypothetical protein
MARPRMPVAYGVFQFCMRMIVFVVEICALAALVTLSKYSEHYPLGYVAVRIPHFFILALSLEVSHSGLRDSPPVFPKFLHMSPTTWCA